jgi:hypothetical protein
MPIADRHTGRNARLVMAIGPFDHNADTPHVRKPDPDDMRRKLVLAGSNRSRHGSSRTPAEKADRALQSPRGASDRRRARQVLLRALEQAKKNGPRNHLVEVSLTDQSFLV